MYLLRYAHTVIRLMMQCAAFATDGLLAVCTVTLPLWIERKPGEAFLST